MLSSTGGEEASLKKTKSINRGSSSSSKSQSSTSSSPSPFSISSLNHTRGDTKTMEEVWKDINLACLQDQETNQGIRRHPHTTSNYRNVILQDFLARPFTKDPPPATIVPTATETSLYGSSSLVPPPAVVLSLNSGSDFHFLDDSDPPRPSSHFQSNPISNVSSFSCPFEALASSTGLPSLVKKRAPESDCGSGDRRHKRMIKNRESAARSRARKQECISLFQFLSSRYRILAT
ncbi:Protein FD [Morella rubra]|uniref:Protein FD n=1 Tax=Morella rubra TaxID=262757 RepID=A0A6A1UI72_9ROSI|nr:Protein FD [Morella rubra]